MAFENSLGALPTLAQKLAAAKAAKATDLARAKAKMAASIPLSEFTSAEKMQVLGMLQKDLTGEYLRYKKFGILALNQPKKSGLLDKVGSVLQNPLSKPMTKAIAKAQERKPGGILGKAVDVGTSLMKVAAVKPTFNIHKTGDELTRAGIGVGKSAEGLVVSINPLNKYLKKFDEKGLAAKKRGGIGGWVAGKLGGIGEMARTHPIATVAVVYAAVVSWPKVSAYLSSPAGTAAIETAGTYAGYAGTAMKLGSALAASRGHKVTDINPDNGMPYTALDEHQDLASMGGPPVALAIAFGVGTVTVLGYGIYKKYGPGSGYKGR